MFEHSEDHLEDIQSQRNYLMTAAESAESYYIAVQNTVSITYES